MADPRDGPDFSKLKMFGEFPQHSAGSKDIVKLLIVNIVDALKLSEQKTKVPLTAFDAHSISDSSARVEEPKSRNVFVKYVKTMTTLGNRRCLIQGVALVLNQ